MTGCRDTVKRAERLWLGIVLEAVTMRDFGTSIALRMVLQGLCHAKFRNQQIACRNYVPARHRQHRNHGMEVGHTNRLELKHARGVAGVTSKPATDT